MPFINKTNNRILPANARAADVAEKAVQEIVPVAQSRFYSAFRVQGVQAILYSRLTSGRKCNCQSARKQINGILDRNGKASNGVINQLLTGDLNFDVTPYNFNQERYLPEASGTNGQTSPTASGNKNQGVFDIATNEEVFPFANVQEKGFGDNGPVSNIDIDDLAGDFDPAVMGFSEVSCGICFGTGFIGGYTPFHAHRQVVAASDATIDGELDLTQTPWVAEATYFCQKIILPKSAIGIDSFQVWNNIKPVPAEFYIDGSRINNITQILAKCDGKFHLVEARFNSRFTHVEFQFIISDESVYFEFPRRPNSADTSLLEQMDPFQIMLSPNVPNINSMDVIVEMQLGKILIVQNDNPWMTRQRNVLGPETQVRVAQPQEIFRILPFPGRIMTKNATTKFVRDNQSGPHRT